MHRPVESAARSGMLSFQLPFDDKAADTCGPNEEHNVELYDFRLLHYSEKALLGPRLQGDPDTPRHLVLVFIEEPPESSRRAPLFTDSRSPMYGDPGLHGHHQLPRNRPFRIKPHATGSKGCKGGRSSGRNTRTKKLGGTLLLWFFHHTSPDRGRALRFCAGCALAAAFAVRVLFAAIRRGMTQFMNISAETASAAEQTLSAGV